MSEFDEDEDDDDNDDNNVEDDHDGSTTDGDAAGEINSSERFLTIDAQKQNISFLATLSRKKKMFTKLSDN